MADVIWWGDLSMVRNGMVKHAYMVWLIVLYTAHQLPYRRPVWEKSGKKKNDHNNNWFCLAEKKSGFFFSSFNDVENI